MSVTAQNLLGFTTDQLSRMLTDLNESSTQACAIMKSVHRQGETDFDCMQFLSKALRAKLATTMAIKPLQIVSERISQDGTCKWLMALADNNCVETVFIPENGRGTLCISSQVGCGLTCSFCATATQGFSRNLTSAEIIGQVWQASQQLRDIKKQHSMQITNVVFMGMGEPLLNLGQVLPALDIIMDDNAYGLSKYRVTVSTSGVVPLLAQLRQKSDVALAVSLHAPNDELRNVLVPINKKYPLSQLMQVCKDYFLNNKKRLIVFEYVMLDNVNDDQTHAQQLVHLLADIPAKINLIPFNPFPGTIYQCSPFPRIEQFAATLKEAGFITTIRKTRGQDIAAACGQLVGDFADRTRRRERA